jgi:hypothetical protein
MSPARLLSLAGFRVVGRLVGSVVGFLNNRARFGATPVAERYAAKPRILFVQRRFVHHHLGGDLRGVPTGVPSLVLVASVLFTSLALAGPLPFQIVSSSIHPDAAHRQTTFTIHFNRAPDLLGLDRDGQLNNSFQYFYDASAAGDGIFDGPSVSIIRGPEIPFRHDIPIRDSLNPTGEDFPHAEGWGKIRGEVPFQLDDAQLRFTIPWKALGETDGRFSYHLIALDHGSQTTDISATVIPLPSGIWLGMTGIPPALWIAWRWRHRAL